MADKDLVLNKEKIETYLKEFASFYEKNGGTDPIELVIVGGAAVVLKHSFRKETHDVDATYPDTPAVCKSIEDVDKKFDLVEGWMNKGVEFLDAAYPLFTKYADVYAVYGKVTVKVVDTDHLIAIKLFACRPGPNDRSDILALMVEEANAGRPVTFERVNKAFVDLYGTWDKCDKDHKKFLEIVLGVKDLLAFRGIYGKRDADDLFRNKDIIKAACHMKTVEEFREYTDALGIDVADENIKNFLQEVKPDENELSDDDMDDIVGGISTNDIVNMIGPDWKAFTASCMRYMKVNPEFVPTFERGKLGADGEWHTTVKIVLGPDGNWVERPVW